MNVDMRDSLSEFQSSIFDASDGHQLVDFIRKKKGLRAQPQKIFDDVPTNRQSLHIEIHRLDEQQNQTTQPEKRSQQIEEYNENQPLNKNATEHDVPASPTKLSINNQKQVDSKTLFRRLSQSIGRRTLLKEFEKTLQESRFLPATCSTPLTGDITTNRTNTMKDRLETADPVNQNIVCTPITITDGESNGRDNQTREISEMVHDLEEEVNFVLERGSKENLLVNDACEDSEEDAPSNPPSLISRNEKTTTPKKVNNRQTFTIQRDNLTGNLILSPSKSVRHSQLPKTPEKSVRSNISTKKLIVTPKQKQLLLSKFGRSSPQRPSPQRPSPQRPSPTPPPPPRSRIPIIVRGNPVAAQVDQEVDTYIESANLSQQHPQTVKIIEEIQRKNTSNAPVIVIPVNQTFNQAPIPEPTSSTTFVQNPRPSLPAQPLPESPVIVKTPQKAFPQASPSSSSEGSPPIKVNSLRIKDILTDDESSDYHPYFSKNRRVLRRRFKKSHNVSQNQADSKTAKKTGRISRPDNKLSLTAKSTHNSSKVREVLKPQQLSQMSDYEILDLRKRNSRGDLRQSLKLTHRESSLLGKQMELELLRRNIQERNYEDEVLQMEVLPPPPNEFCDTTLQRVQKDTPIKINDFVDEMSGDRVSLNRRDRHSKSIMSQKHTKKKKKISEHVERYLETSQKIHKSKYMNLSKRKLYNKGESEICSSSDSLTPKKRSPVKQTPKRKSSNRNSSKVPASPPPPPSHQLTPPTLIQPPDPVSPLPSTQPTRSPPPKQASLLLSPRRSYHQQSVNKSGQSVEFLPQNNEVSTKPVKQKKKYNKKPKTIDPVDPDKGTDFVSINNQENPCRRSKREKKLPMAYWSSTQKEFKPLYDYNEVLQKQHKGKTAPTVKKNLVANTKEVKNSEVGESGRVNKKSTENKTKSKRTKQRKQPEDSESERVSRKSSEPHTQPEEIQRATETEEDAFVDNVVPRKELSTHQSKLTKKVGRPRKNKSQISTQGNEFVEDDPFPDMTLDTNADKGLSGNEQTMSNTESSKAHEREPLSKLNQLSTSMQGSSGYSSDVSSVQQIRLATIIEDSVPLVLHSNINSTMSSVNHNRLSRELMPPPSSTELIRNKKSSSKVKKKNSKKNAFRTDHDESIAEVSSDHFNKLFDQLKNSSICPTMDAPTAEGLKQNNCSGQASAQPHIIESNPVLERKWKNVAIRLPRMKIREKSTHRNEKVCDSGFSSEDMPSVPKQKGDVLLNWLKQIIVNNKSSSGPDKGVARFLQADGFHASSVEDLIFQEVDGVEYAFYDTKNPFSIGYIRFNPKTGKKKCTAKKYELNFVILSGKVNITVNDTKFDCKNGDLITVFIGTSYVIQNTSNDPALVMVIKK